MAELTKAEYGKLKTVKTEMFRVSFPKVFKAHAFEEGQKAKYSVVMLFPKTKDLTPMKKAVQAAILEKWGSDKSKHPKTLRLPFRDGDEKTDLEGYSGHIFVSASSEQKPGLITYPDKLPITEESEFYAGCFARAELKAFAYDTKGNKGVSFAVQNIQKLKDGPAFSGRKAAEETFDDDFEFDDTGLGVEDSGELDMGF